jgi:hypothetical protein
MVRSMCHIAYLSAVARCGKLAHFSVNRRAWMEAIRTTMRKRLTGMTAMKRCVHVPWTQMNVLLCGNKPGVDHSIVPCRICLSVFKR